MCGIVSATLAVAAAWSQQAPDAGAPATTEQAPEPGESPWPYRIESDETSVLVYPPQLTSWDGFQLHATAAVSAATGEGANPTFGIVEISARTLVDKESRVVTLEDYRIEDADFPAASSRSAAWVEVLERDAAGRSRTLALDRLEAALELSGTQTVSEHEPLVNEPPKIIFSQTPAILVYVDGEPELREVEGTKYERVVNTRPLLVRGKRDRMFLHVFDGWMTAESIDGEWSVDTSPPGALDEVLEKATETRQVDLLTGQTSADEPPPTLTKEAAPTIYVETSPAELIVIDGEPRWVPIPETQLLFVENTTGHLFKLVSDQSTYVLISGRWFRASSEDGPWEFVSADRLPPDFASIPDSSVKENVKASVAGTPQAREAAIAATVPSTAAVAASTAVLTPPVFDGEPKLEPIEGTTLAYVANCATPIIQVDATNYYAVENAIWFHAGSVQGPWTVATVVPPVIYTIPLSSPLHYVTHVKVYGTSGDTVYVGYSPGYEGTYVDPTTNVVVYGTGYSYTPWIGSVWYGPPVTYGFGVSIRYTPWTGWAVGFGFGWTWGNATVSVGWGWGAYPWWGPWGWGWSYGPPVYPVYSPWYGAAAGAGGAAAWGPGGWAATSGNVYGRWGDVGGVARTSEGFNAWTGNRWASEVGMAYNSRTGVLAAGQRGAVQNVYTGDFATGARGAATGPGGVTAAGRAGTVGNVNTGREVSGGRGVVYDRDTGQATTGGFVRGEQGAAARVDDDVYAGGDGNVYRRTDNGWQQNVDGNWQATQAQRDASQAQSRAQRDAARAQSDARMQSLERDYSARAHGAQRYDAYRGSTARMNRSFGGGGMRRR